MKRWQSSWIGVCVAAGMLAAGAVWAQSAPELLKGVTAEKYPGADTVVVQDDTRVEVEPSGLSHVYRTQLIKALTETGAARLSVLRTDYDPASSFAEVQSAVLHRVSGDTVKVAPEEVTDLPQPQEMIYWGPRMKLTAFPKLDPGDAVELKTYSKGFVIAYLGDTPPTMGPEERYIPPMRGHYYEVVLFQGESPIVKKSYTLTVPQDKPVRSKIYNGELGFESTFGGGKITYQWWKENVSAVEREPRMVEDTDAFPKLVLATVPDWPEKSRWFYKVNEDIDAFAWDDAILAKVKEITAGLKTDEEKRMALLAWVARQIRYSGITMGKGEGYTLHPAKMTFYDRSGVCKDIAGMLVAMLRAAGYKTYAAMTMAGAKVEDLPADQFNHCVVAVETEPGEFQMYDPTWCPFSAEPWSSAEKPQNFVVGTERGEILMETPPATAEDNFVKVVSDAALNERGDLEGTFVITGGHYSETNLRWGVVNANAADVRPSFEQWLTKLSPRAELVSWSSTDPVDVRTPFVLTLKYKVPGYALASEGKLVFKLPAAQNIVSSRRLTDFVSAVAGDKRTYDIFLRSTRQFLFEETLRLPKGWKLQTTPSAKSVEAPAAGFSASVSFKEGVVKLSERLSVKKKIIPASEYPGLKEAWEAQKSFAGQWAVAVK